MHQTVLKMARSMIFESYLPLSFWGDVVEYSAYILNRSPSYANANNASPIEELTNQVPGLGYVVVFGSLCMVYRETRKNSLAHRAQIGMIVVPSDETKGYRVFLRKEHIVIVTQHIKNIEAPIDNTIEQ